VDAIFVQGRTKNTLPRGYQKAYTYIYMTYTFVEEKEKFVLFVEEKEKFVLLEFLKTVYTKKFLEKRVF